MNEDKEKLTLTAEMLKKHFNKTRQRKYDLPKIFLLLEKEFFHEYYVIPNFDLKNYEGFSSDFDKLLDSSTNLSTKNMIIDKYGLLGGEPVSYSELSYKHNCSISKIYSQINNAFENMKKNEYYVDQIKKYFNLKLKNDTKKKEDINFILDVVRNMDNGEYYD